MNPRLQRRPQWQGYPIPFFATQRTDGTWDFKVVSEPNRMRCAKESLCWVCGEPLLTPIVFLGGPAATEKLLYNDGPMHPECADDALALCPFMIGSMDYAKSFDLSKHEPGTEFVTGKNRPAGLVPPDMIYRIVANGFKIAVYPYNDQVVWFFHPNQPSQITGHPRRPGAINAQQEGQSHGDKQR